MSKTKKQTFESQFTTHDPAKLTANQKVVDKILDAKGRYNILGLDKNATDIEVKSNFRKLSKAVHPDHNFGYKDKAEKAFNKLKNAYESHMSREPEPEEKPEDEKAEYEEMCKQLHPTTLRAKHAESFLAVARNAIITHEFKTYGGSHEIRIPGEAGSFTRKFVSRSAKKAYEIITEALEKGASPESKTQEIMPFESQTMEIDLYESAMQKVLKILENKPETLSCCCFFTFGARAPSTANLYETISDGFKDYMGRYPSEQQYPTP